MQMKQNLQIRAVIHLSSTAVYTVVGYPDNHGKILKIMAVGVAKTNGFFGGQIANHQELLEAIKQSANQAMDMAGLDIFDVGLSFATPSMASGNGKGGLALVTPNSTSAGRIIHSGDVLLILEQLQHELLESRYYPIQISTQFAQLDDDSKRITKNPVGLYAKSLFIGYHAISVPRTYHQQMDAIFAKSSLGIHPTLFAGVAGAEYALSKEEKERGVCFVDIGAGVTNVCVYSGGMLVFSRCLSVAGRAVDLDIARWLNVSVMEAEFIKQSQGSAYSSDKPKSHFITLQRNGKHDEIIINQHELASVIEDRYYAIFTKIFQSLDKEELMGFLKAGIVLAGGGSKIKDLQRMIERRFNIAVRQMNVNNCVSICANHLNDDNIRRINGYLSDNVLHNAIGALLYQQHEQYAQDERFLYSQEHPQQGLFGRLSQRYHQWTNRLKRWM